MPKVDREPLLTLTDQVDSKVFGPGNFQGVNLEGAFVGMSAFNHTVLRGKLIQDSLDAIIKVQEVSKGSADRLARSTLAESGMIMVTIPVEIVDSKCHLGTMNPGRFKPHRAYAIRCIEGGIPPILVAHDASGTLAHDLIVGEDGSAINAEVLGDIAEHVQVTAMMKKVSDGKILYVDPKIDRQAITS